jgi:hypothetical protein
MLYLADHQSRQTNSLWRVSGPEGIFDFSWKNLHPDNLCRLLSFTLYLHDDNLMLSIFRCNS